MPALTSGHVSKRKIVSKCLFLNPNFGGPPSDVRFVHFPRKMYSSTRTSNHSCFAQTLPHQNQVALMTKPFQLEPRCTVFLCTYGCSSQVFISRIFFSSAVQVRRWSWSPGLPLPDILTVGVFFSNFLLQIL